MIKNNARYNFGHSTAFYLFWETIETVHIIIWTQPTIHLVFSHYILIYLFIHFRNANKQHFYGLSAKKDVFRLNVYDSLIVNAQRCKNIFYYDENWELWENILWGDSKSILKHEKIDYLGINDVVGLTPKLRFCQNKQFLWINFD